MTSTADAGGNNPSCPTHCPGTLGKSTITDWYDLEETSLVHAHWVKNRTTHSLRACSLQCQNVLQCNSIIWKNTAGIPDDCMLIQTGASMQINMDPMWSYWMQSEYHKYNIKHVKERSLFTLSLQRITTIMNYSWGPGSGTCDPRSWEICMSRKCIYRFLITPGHMTLTLGPEKIHDLSKSSIQC